jgi:hypothetical protein
MPYQSNPWRTGWQLEPPAPQHRLRLVGHRRLGDLIQQATRPGRYGTRPRAPAQPAVLLPELLTPLKVQPYSLLERGGDSERRAQPTVRCRPSLQSVGIHDRARLPVCDAELALQHHRYVAPHDPEGPTTHDGVDPLAEHVDRTSLTGENRTSVFAFCSGHNQKDMIHDAQKVIKVAEAARVLQCSVSTLRRRDRGGVFATRRDPSGARVYTPSDIDELRELNLKIKPGRPPSRQPVPPKPKPSRYSVVIGNETLSLTPREFAKGLKRGQRLPKPEGRAA